MASSGYTGIVCVVAHSAQFAAPRGDPILDLPWREKILREDLEELGEPLQLVVGAVRPEIDEVAPVRDGERPRNPSVAVRRVHRHEQAADVTLHLVTVAKPRAVRRLSEKRRPL